MFRPFKALLVLLGCAASLTACPEVPSPLSRSVGTPSPSPNAKASLSPTSLPRTQEPKAALVQGNVLLAGPASEDARISQAAPPVGDLGGGKVDLSGTYTLTLPTNTGKPWVLALPVTTSAGLLEGSFQPESWDPQQQRWRPLRSYYATYLPEAQTVVFDLQLPTLAFQTTQATPTTLRLRITGESLSGLKIVEREGSPFRYYYRDKLPPASAPTGGTSGWPLHTHPVASLLDPFSIQSELLPTDAEWKSVQATQAEIPDFLEDLEETLTTTYQRLVPPAVSGTLSPGLSLQDKWLVKQVAARNWQIFSAPRMGKINITFADQSDGGITNRYTGNITFRNRFDNAFDMRTTAAHELVHSLQRAKYSFQLPSTVPALVNAIMSKLYGENLLNLNLWMIESTATFLSQEVNQLTTAERFVYVRQFLGPPYLYQSLTTADEMNVYALSHFLNWLADQTGGSTFLSQTLNSFQPSDFEALDSALVSSGKFTGVGGAWGQYGRYLMTQANAGDEFINTALSNLLSSSAVHLTDANGKSLKGGGNPVRLGVGMAFARLKREQEPLSMTQIKLIPLTAGQEEGLLVIDAAETHPNAFKSFTWVGSGPELFQNPPLAQDTAFPPAQPITVKHFGGGSGKKEYHQLLVNTSAYLHSSTAKLEFWLLLPSQILENKAGAVTWDTQGITGIPLDTLKHYEIYQNGILLGTAPIPTTGQSQTFTSEKLSGFGSQIQVVLVDKYDHRWPEVVQKAGTLSVIATSGVQTEYIDPVSGQASAAVLPGTEVTLKATATDPADEDLLWHSEVIFNCGNGDVQFLSSGLTATIRSSNTNLGLKITLSSKRHPEVKTQYQLNFVTPGSLPCTAE